MANNALHGTVMNRPPTPVEFDTTDRPSMGDQSFVEGQVKEMLDECRKMLFEAPEGSNPKVEIVKLAEKWRDRLWAGNTEFVQTLTPEAQNVWLQEHDLGRDDPDPKAGIGGLVVATLNRFVDAVIPFAEKEIDEEQLQFRLDTAVEDCTMLLLGLENPGD